MKDFTPQQTEALRVALNTAKLENICNADELKARLRLYGCTEEDARWAIEQWKSYEDRRLSGFSPRRRERFNSYG